jgi:DNA-binding PadR family transcriptional regulator
MDEKQYENMILELRRGAISLAVLGQLCQEAYGYSLIKLLKDRGLEVDQGTLYPLLRRLESAGLLESEWRVEGPRPRRYYKTAPAGVEILNALAAEWGRLDTIIKELYHDRANDE